VFSTVCVGRCPPCGFSLGGYRLRLCLKTPRGLSVRCRLAPRAPPPPLPTYANLPSAIYLSRAFLHRSESWALRICLFLFPCICFGPTKTQETNKKPHPGRFFPNSWRGVVPSIFSRQASREVRFISRIHTPLFRPLVSSFFPPPEPYRGVNGSTWPSY